MHPVPLCHACLLTCQYKLLYTTSNNIEVYEESVPRTKKIPYIVANFEPGEENRIEYESLYCMHAPCHTCMPCHICMPCHACSKAMHAPCHAQLHAHMPSPVDRITDRCKNITFPQLRLRALINLRCDWTLNPLSQW